MFATGGGEYLFGTAYAQHVIYKHQHPTSCADKKFLVYRAVGNAHGLGSTFHVNSVAMAEALFLDRILVFEPQPSEAWIDDPFCNGTLNYDDCYFEPISSCSYADAVRDDFGNTYELKDLVLQNETNMQVKCPCVHNRASQYVQLQKALQAVD